jgi:hypothetical protein
MKRRSPNPYRYPTHFLEVPRKKVIVGGEFRR